MKLVRYLASLKLTLAGMSALAAGVLVSYRDDSTPVAWLVVPLLVLAVNLLCALVVNPRFRQQPALFVFHVCLLAIVMLAAWGQMTSLEGRAELVMGQSFTAASVTHIRQGGWHPLERLDDVAFVQGPFRVDYAPGLKRGQTENRVFINSGQAGPRTEVFGDNIPLRQAGYSFYTTSNKGYAAILEWTGNNGTLQRGAVHFPSYPLYDWNQVNHWTSPAGEQIALQLHLPDRPVHDRDWVLNSAAGGAVLAVNLNGRSVVMEPGVPLSTGSGTLQLESVRMWMGYEVFYNPVLPWLFVAAIIGVLSMAWYFLVKFSVLPLPEKAVCQDKKEGRQGVTAHV